jgi:hypothetical protein
VRSVSFRTLYWVVHREAVVRILFPSQVGTRGEHNCRVVVSTPETVSVDRVAQAVLAARPERRYFEE